MSTVFFDVDTQIDFLFPAGALYVPGAETILPAVSRLNQFAASNNIPLISTTDAHAEDDPEFHYWPPHCVLGTLGQQKPQATVVPAQIVLRKVTIDAFAAPELTPLLDRLNADHYVVYGVVTEVCVGRVVRGLLKRGNARIEVVTDAVRSIDEAKAKALYEELTAAGGTLTTTAEVCTSTTVLR